MITPSRPTLPQGLSPNTLRSLTSSVPPGKFPTNPWVAQLNQPRMPGLGNSRAGFSPNLSRGAWRGAGGLAALAAAGLIPRLIPGEGGKLETGLTRAATGAAAGAPFGAPGMAVGALANSILGLV